MMNVQSTNERKSTDAKYSKDFLHFPNKFALRHKLNSHVWKLPELEKNILPTRFTMKPKKNIKNYCLLGNFSLESLGLKALVPSKILKKLFTMKTHIINFDPTFPSGQRLTKDGSLLEGSQILRNKNFPGLGREAETKQRELQGPSKRLLFVFFIVT